MASGTTVDKLDACCLTEYCPLPGSPQGQIINIAGINTYYIAGKDETSKGKAIVILTDIFGMFLLSVNTLLSYIKYYNRSNKKSTYHG
jgi:hypothetical protein